VKGSRTTRPLEQRRSSGGYPNLACSNSPVTPALRDGGRGARARPCRKPDVLACLLALNANACAPDRLRRDRLIMLRDKWIESAEMGKDMANKQSGPSSRSKEPSFGEFVARHERERAALEFLFPSEAAGTNTLATALQRRPSLPPPFRELKDHPCSDCLKRRLARTAEMHTRRIYWSGCAGWVPGLPGAAWKTRRGPKPRDGDDLREVDRNRRAETRSAEAWPRPSTEPLSHERLAINAS
jgi:hypothetical protein